jgi:hypothetical protein
LIAALPFGLPDLSAWASSSSATWPFSKAQAIVPASTHLPLSEESVEVSVPDVLGRQLEQFEKLGLFAVPLGKQFLNLD